jgi:hypothetical protein
MKNFSPKFSSLHILMPTIVSFSTLPLLPSTHECSDALTLFSFVSVDTVIPIKFSDAVELKIVFDKRCRTESGCDYLRFFQPSNIAGVENIIGAPKYHGRNPSDWPGVGTTPPLIVKGSFVEARFHSDGSNNDWGYYFTGQPILPRLHSLKLHAYAETFSSFSIFSYTGAAVSFFSLHPLVWGHIVNFVATYTRRFARGRPF